MYVSWETNFFTGYGFYFYHVINYKQCFLSVLSWIIFVGLGYYEWNLQGFNCPWVKYSIIYFILSGLTSNFCIFWVSENERNKNKYVLAFFLNFWSLVVIGEMIWYEFGQQPKQIRDSINIMKISVIIF